MFSLVSKHGVLYMFPIHVPSYKGNIFIFVWVALCMCGYIISLADCRESNKTFHRNLFQYHYFLLRHERKIKVFPLPSPVPYRSTRTSSLFYYKHFQDGLTNVLRKENLRYDILSSPNHFYLYSIWIENVYYICLLILHFSFVCLVIIVY